MSETNKEKILTVTAIAAAIGAAVGSYAGKDLFNSDSGINEHLREIAEETNKNLPITLDSETRFDSTIGINGTFTYNYTLTNYSYEDIDEDMFRNNMSTKLLNNYCTSEDMKQFLDSGVSVNFVYFGKAGKQVSKFSYQPPDCEDS